MAVHKMRCVESENRLDEWLNGKWELKHVYPVYHNYYRRYIMKNEFTDHQPTAITIKKNGVVLMTIDRCTTLPKISAKQRKLSRSSSYPNWIRVEFGCDKINAFFKELGTDMFKYL